MGRPTGMLPPTAANAAYQQSGFSRKGQPTGPPGVANGQPPPGFGMLDAYRQAAQQRLGQQGQYPNQPYQVGLQQTPPGMWGGMRAGMADPIANALQQRQQQFRQRQYTPPSPGVAGGATPPGLQLGMQDAHRQAAQQRAAMQGQQGGQLPLGLQNHPGYQQAQQRLGQRGQPATPMRQQMMVHALRNLR